MSDNEIYQELILDHFKHPRNYHEMDDHSHSAEGHNPLCGDELEIYVKVENSIIKDVSFKGAGCAISQASASLMTEKLMGLSTKEALTTFEKVHTMLTGKNPDEMSEKEIEDLGKVGVLSGVCNYPMRVKCASLAWHTIKAAIEKGESRQVSTE